MFNKNKIEVIPFNEFMSRPAYRIPKKIPLTNSIFSFLPPITLKGLFPLHEPAFALFVLGGGLIVATAFVEYLLAENDSGYIASIISSAASVLFPIVAYGAVFWFIFFGM
ncbi:hypothetical protein [Cytobacillus luteolus]|uniref:hypothetical protein n=1 Tax=Litchfieldia luteola TaxID=682179 RepID=UPI001AE58A22|nr:hypothetical protein [Cytobacillus luteolus]MBP1944653.1 hypothetical protein [Cytobacillus luteolus]